MAPNDPEIFRRHGTEPTEKKILVLKSRGHFRAAYEVFARQIIEVDAPGLTSPNLKQFPYRNVRRPIFPLDDI
jgi:microcystin degradation protein MlrC